MSAARVIFDYLIKFDIKLSNGQTHNEIIQNRKIICIPYKMDKNTIISVIKPSLENIIKLFYADLNQKFSTIDPYSTVLFNEMVVMDRNGEHNHLINNDECISYRFNADNGSYVR